MFEPIERPKMSFKSNPLFYVGIALILVSSLMSILHHSGIALVLNMAALALIMVAAYKRPSFPSLKR